MSDNPIKDMMNTYDPPIRWWQFRRFHLALLVEQTIRFYEREKKIEEAKR